MKREIKFRAWDNYNNKFFEPIYEAYNNKLEELNIGMSGDLSIREMTNSPKHESLFPSRFILMQFTGLLDKNGKEIYEGDIVEITRHPKLSNSYKEKEVIEYAIWQDQEYGNWYSGFELDGIGDCEVIGNIYENKDLLNV